ncbi:hypothetical protein NMY22_g14006 [Coprinellus aureogranulatus]|nr:hypothetical protein NMY22_g14006 [Coprinellus aureogranulatus]
MTYENILRTIFAHSLPEDRTQIVLHPSQPPLSLMNVCRTWRMLVLSQPELWTCLKIVEGALPGNSAFYRKCVKASGSLPLRLQLEVRPSLENQFLPSSSLLDGTLLSSSRRLTNLTLNRVPLIPIHDLRSGYFPVLESLALSFVEDELRRFDWNARGRIKAFKECRSLRRVALGNCGFRQCDSYREYHTVLLPFSQLTHVLDIDTRDDTCSDRLFLKYIYQCPNLRFLFVPQTPEDKRIVLSDGVPRVPYLIAPSLEHLALESGGEGEEWMLIVASFAMPKLRSLRLTCKTLSTWVLLDVFKVLPSVERLDVTTEEGGVDELLRLLTLSPQNGAQSLLLPRLRTLVLTVHQEIDTLILNQFLQSRRNCPPVHSLRELVLCTSKPKFLASSFSYIALIQSWVHSDDQGMGFRFERIVTCPEEEGNVRRWNMRWMDRDPELQDWREVVGFLGCM